MKKLKIDVSELLKKPYLNEHEASAITRRAVATLRNERFLGRGFPYIKIGRSILYSTADLLDTLESNKVNPTTVIKSHICKNCRKYKTKRCAALKAEGYYPPEDDWCFAWREKKQWKQAAIKSRK